MSPQHSNPADDKNESSRPREFTRNAKPSRRANPQRRSVSSQQGRSSMQIPPSRARSERQQRTERQQRVSARAEASTSERSGQTTQRSRQERPGSSEGRQRPKAPANGQSNQIIVEARPRASSFTANQQSWFSMGVTALIALVVVVGIALCSKGLSLNMPDYAAILEKHQRSIAAISERHNAQNQQQVAAEPVALTVTFAGDCTLGTDEAFDYSRSFNAKYEREDAAYFLKNVADIFGSDDLTVVNMEGTLTTETTRADKTFAFKGKPEYAKVLSSASVEAASMANNHSRDYGEQSYADTLEALDAEGIETFGYQSIAYMDVKGVKVALVGVYELAENAGIRDEMVARISEAKANGAQLTLVYVHWGVERESAPNDTQMMLGRAAIDAGADLVVGSHPHVIQGWEVYKGCYIVYSLGNFCFGGNDSPSDMDCMMFQQTFTVQGSDVVRDDNVDFIACRVSSVDGYNNYQPTPATGDEKARIDQKIQASTDAIAARASSLVS